MEQESLRMLVAAATYLLTIVAVVALLADDPVRAIQAAVIAGVGLVFDEILGR